MRALPRSYGSLDMLDLTLVALEYMAYRKAPVWTCGQRRALPVVFTFATRPVVFCRTVVIGRHTVVGMIGYIGHLTWSIHLPHAAFECWNIPLG